jgi:UDP-GlcNAc:undecaprenyl-phosphate GlcNAc-1-phosphate transferase
MGALLIPATAAVATTLLVTPIARYLAIRCGYLDVPSDRSSHDRPTPRAGGYAILAGLTVGVSVMGLWRDGTVAIVFFGAILLAALALFDELRALPRIVRLMLQVAIAVAVVRGIDQTGSLGSLNSSVLSGWRLLAAALALVWLVGLINTYNFMDGLNGMAAVSAVVIGSALAVLAIRRGDLPAAVLASSAAGAAAGFLPFNLPSGSIFMGDSGSTVLGLTFGALVLDAVAAGVSPAVALLPLAPFVLDAGTTVVRRAARGERFFSTPHRSHYYQRLQQQGWSHAAVAGLYGALAFLSATVALALDYQASTSARQAVAVAGVILCHALVFFCVHVGWVRHTRRDLAPHQQVNS